MRKSVNRLRPHLSSPVLVITDGFKSQNQVHRHQTNKRLSYVIPAPGSAVIWLVINTATLYSERTRNAERSARKPSPWLRPLPDAAAAAAAFVCAGCSTFGDLLQPGEHLGQFLLPLSQLPPTRKVHSEQGHDGVDDLTPRRWRTSAFKSSQPPF